MSDRNGMTWGPLVRIAACRACFDKMERARAFAEQHPGAPYMPGLCSSCRERLETAIAALPPRSKPEPP
jgi:hypothetical protein